MLLALNKVNLQSTSFGQCFNLSHQSRVLKREEIGLLFRNIPKQHLIMIVVLEVIFRYVPKDH